MVCRHAMEDPDHDRTGIVEPELRGTVCDSMSSVPEGAWEDLWNRAPKAHVYQTHAWYASWALHFPHVAQRVLLVWAKGRLVGACPLHIFSQGLGPLRRHVLTMMSSFSVAYPLDQGPLVDASSESSVIQVLAEGISSMGGFDVMRFELFERGSLAERLLEAVAQRTRHRVTYGLESTSHLVPLSDSSDGFLASLGPETRRTVRRSRRRFLRDEGHEVRLVETGREMEHLLGALREQKRKRFGGSRCGSTFEGESLSSFLWDLCPRLLGQGRAAGLVAMIENEIVATQLLFLDEHGHAYSYNYSFDPDRPRLRLSYVIESIAFEHLIARGYRAIDLSTGNDVYKGRWSRGTGRELHRGTVVIRRLANAPFRLAERMRAGASRLKALRHVAG